MKKVVTLMLVLSMVSMASAALSLTVDGQDTAAIELLPSDSIWIGVESDDTLQYQCYIIMTVTDPALGEWTGGNVVSTPPLISPPGWTYFGTAVDPSMDAWFGDLATVGSEPNPTIGVGGAVEYHGLGVGDVTVTLYDSFFVPIDTLTVTQIPEPATMALLGLGGLLLRRKKQED